MSLWLTALYVHFILVLLYSLQTTIKIKLKKKGK